MGSVATTEIFNAPQKVVYGVIADYSAYPEFLTDVKRVSVLESQPDKKLVEYEVQVIKSFRYQLWMYEKPNFEVSWKLHDGDMFKENTGGWYLKDLGDGRTQAEYKINAKFGMFVPSMIEKKLIEVNLPSMMNAYRERIASKL